MSQGSGSPGLEGSPPAWPESISVGATADVEMARVLAEYNDLCASGGEMEVSQFLKRHPDCSPELFADLEVFRDLRSFLDSPRPHAPEKFEDFELLTELGGGTYGIVYEAHELSLDRRVALKVLQHRFLDDRKTVDRFRREAKIIARFDHPNLVRVHSIRTEGNPYINMELVDGEDLKKVLTALRDARRPLAGEDSRRWRFWRRRRRTAGPEDAEAAEPAVFGPVTREVHALFQRDEAEYYRQAAGWFAGAADGLQHAHDLGVVHRDVKPANLMLDREGRLRVVDFGLARAEGLTQASLTGDHRVGTLLYMSPEQVEEESRDLKASTDIYSLGVALYEALTLRSLYPGLPQSEVLDRIRLDDLPALTKLNPGVPDELDAIVRKCLEKKSAERFKTAGALAAELRRFVVDPATVETLPPSPVKRAVRYVANRQKGIAQVAGAALLVVALGLLLQVGWNDARKKELADYHDRVQGFSGGIFCREERKKRPFVDSSRAREAPHDPRGFSAETPDLSKAATDSLLEPETRLREAEPELADDTLPLAQDGLEAAARSQPHQARAYFYLARIHALNGETDLAIANLELALREQPDFTPAKVLRRLLEPDGAGAAEPEEEWARAWIQAAEHEDERRWDAAASAWEQARLLLARDQSYDWLVTEVVLWQGVAERNAQDYGSALVSFGYAARATGRLEPIQLLGGTWLLDGKPEYAEQLFERYFHAARKAGEGRDVEAARAFASVYREVGRVEDALSWAKKALDLDRNSSRARIAVGYAFLAKGKHTEAEQSFEDAARLAPADSLPLIALAVSREERDPPDLEGAAQRLREAIAMDPDSGEAHYRLARILRRQERVTDAVQSYREAIRCRDGYSPLAHNNLGTLLELEELPLEKAIAEYQRAIELDPQLAVAHFNLAWAYQRQCRFWKAVPEYERAVQLGLDDAVVHINLGSCLQYQLDPKAAISEYEAAIQRDGSNPLPYKSIASCYIWRADWTGIEEEKKEHWQKATAFYAQALDLKPDWAEARHALGYHRALLGEGEEAIADFRKTLEDVPWYQRPYEDLARLLLTHDRPVPAGEEIESEIRTFEPAEPWAEPESHAHLIEVLDRYRTALLPRLATFASIDWIIDRPQPLISERATALHAAGASRESGSPVELNASFRIEDSTLPQEVLLRVRARKDEQFGVTLNGEAADGMLPHEREPAEAEDEVARRARPFLYTHRRLDAKRLQSGDNVLRLRSSAGFAEDASLVLLAAPSPQLKKDRARDGFQAFLRVADPGSDRGRIDYFEGRLLALDGSHGEAIRRFERAAAADPERPEPHVQLAASLGAEGNHEAAAEALAEALASGLDDARLWDGWVQAVLVEHPLSLETVVERLGGILEGLPAQPSRPDGRGQDLLWAFTSLKQGNSLRINCGGRDHLTATESWGKDRFHHGPGLDPYLVELESTIGDREDTAVLMNSRLFWSRDPIVRGYSIPLPPGAYQVTLTFVEAWKAAGDRREFDVLLEGEAFLKNYKPLEKGFGVFGEWTQEVKTRDGVLNIDFKRRGDDPEVCSVVVERLAESRTAEVK